VFTANRAAPTQQLVNQVAAVAVIKNIYRRFDTLKQEPIAAKEAAPNESQEPPKEPGVYYKDGSNWSCFRNLCRRLKFEVRRSGS
jgi:hypothetical protein